METKKEDRGGKIEDRRWTAAAAPSSILYSPSSISTPSSIRSARRGFSFAEVMFAVVILGIGFIMVAAVFPVAIRQTQSTSEENNAAIAARTAANAIAKVAMTQSYAFYDSTYSSADPTNDASAYKTVQQYPVFPPTVKNYAMTSNVPNVVAPPAIIVPFLGARWDQLKANILQNSDPRFSYQVFYRRENGSSVMELIVIAVANRNQTNFGSADYDSSALHSAVMVAVSRRQQYTAAPSATATTIVPDTVTLTNPPNLPAGYTSFEGFSLSLPPPLILPPYSYPTPAARTYSIGRLLASGNQYEVNAGDNFELTADSNGLWGEDPLNHPTLKLSDPISDPQTATQTLILNAPSNLQPTTGYIESLVASPANPAGQITLDIDSTSFAAPTAAVPGAYVIIADDFPMSANTSDTPPTYTLIPNYTYSSNYPAIPSYQVGALNGRIFRLGQPVTSAKPGNFYLDPAYGMRLAQGTLPSADTYPPPYWAWASKATANPRMKCYLFGAGATPGVTPIPGQFPSKQTSGPSQDVGVFVTYIAVQ